MVPAAGNDAETAAVRQLVRPVVLVTRDGRIWQAEVVALGVVRKARSLHAVDRLVRQLLGSDVVDYEFHTGDEQLDRLVRQIRAAREAVQLQEKRIHKLMGQVLLRPGGGALRDLAVLVGLSHQRVHQLLKQQLSIVEVET